MRRLVAQAAPVFGICFGGQLLATAVGGTVAPMGFRYRGWRTNEHAAAPIWRGPWLRWHGDFITLPESVEVFATDHGTVQAFRQGNAVGVQFHPEVDNALLRAWRCEADIANPVVADAFAAAIRYADTHATSIEDQAFTLFEQVFAMLLG
jgi:GMP synthase-like glutamine amidotransferase